MDAIERTAEISECGKYRWNLRRVLTTDNNKVVCFVMLNPSTADAEIDDPTVRRCMQYARDWGYGILEVRNIFALRATDPRELRTTKNPEGDPRGLESIAEAKKADLIVAAWGATIPFKRDVTVCDLFKDGTPVHCLRKTKLGYPVHPLYQLASLKPTPYWNC